jgi:hypothetical protein
MLVRSPDGGRSWLPATAVVSEATQAFLPALAINANGILGLTFYDLRHDVTGDSALTTDVWFRTATGPDRPWTEHHLAGPFDLRTTALAVAPFPPGPPFWLGYQQALRPAPGGFAAAFTLGGPESTVGPTDVFFAAALVGGAPPDCDAALPSPRGVPAKRSATAQSARWTAKPKEQKCDP